MVNRWFLLKCLGALLMLGAIFTCMHGGLSLPSKMSSARYHFAGVSLLLLAAAQGLIGWVMFWAAHRRVERLTTPLLLWVLSAMLLFALAIVQSALY